VAVGRVKVDEGSLAIRNPITQTLSVWSCIDLLETLRHMICFSSSEFILVLPLSYRVDLLKKIFLPYLNSEFTLYITSAQQSIYRLQPHLLNLKFTIAMTTRCVCCSTSLDGFEALVLYSVVFVSPIVRN
jgi:hypothetical protein